MVGDNETACEGEQRKSKAYAAKAKSARGCVAVHAFPPPQGLRHSCRPQCNTHALHTLYECTEYRIEVAKDTSSRAT